MESADPSLPSISTLNLRIASSNNFPTAAGLASSAAGFAALVRAIADLYNLPESASDLSPIARQGSGSACRSLMGGYVSWEAGQQEDGTDSIAIPIQPVAHWPGMRALIFVISAARKDMPSTSGMQATVATSALFATRAKDIVPQRMKEMIKAIGEKDFNAFGLLTMRDSNTFHSTCADTYPPIFYMTDASRAAVRFVEAINGHAGKIICAYTFDAGPNAVIFYEAENAAIVEGAAKSIVGQVEGWPESNNIENITVQVNEKVIDLLREGVSRVILTEIGEGPISVQNHLIDERGELVR